MARRAPFTEQEITEIAEKYTADTHSMADLAREYGSNTTSISKLLHSLDVPIRPPGGSAFQVQKQREAIARQKAERDKRKAEDKAFASYQANLEAAEKATAVPPRAASTPVAGQSPFAQQTRAALGQSEQERVEGYLDGLAARMLRQEAEASTRLDGETHVVGEPTGYDAPGGLEEHLASHEHEETMSEATWTPIGTESPQEFSALLNQVEELVAGMGSFSVLTDVGHLRWVRKGDTFFPEDRPSQLDQTDKINKTLLPGLVGDPESRQTLADLPSGTGWQPMPEDPKHQQELQRAHEAGKRQWESGHAFGWDQATDAVKSFLERWLEDEKGDDATLTELRKAIERGEHWYHFRRDPRPWNSSENWGRRE